MELCRRTIGASDERHYGRPPGVDAWTRRRWAELLRTLSWGFKLRWRSDASVPCRRHPSRTGRTRRREEAATQHAGTAERTGAWSSDQASAKRGTMNVKSEKQAGGSGRRRRGNAPATAGPRHLSAPWAHRRMPTARRWSCTLGIQRCAISTSDSAGLRRLPHHIGKRYTNCTPRAVLESQPGRCAGSRKLKRGGSAGWLQERIIGLAMLRDAVRMGASVIGCRPTGSDRPRRRGRPRLTALPARH